MEARKAVAREPRLNTLIIADAIVGDRRWTVRVRNVSQRGALIETDVVLTPGSSIFLTRGHLCISAQVVWRRLHRYGVRFDEEVQIELWDVASKSDLQASRAENVRQPISKELLAKRIAEELDLAARTISIVDAALIESPLMRVKHANEMQQMRTVRQVLAELSSILQQGISEEKVGAIATGDLRNRILR